MRDPWSSLLTPALLKLDVQVNVDSTPQYLMMDSATLESLDLISPLQNGLLQQACTAVPAATTRSKVTLPPICVVTT